MKSSKDGAGAPAATAPAREQAASKSKEKAKVKKASRVTAAQRDFLARLQHLRSVAQEVSQAYLANLEHDILELIDLVGDHGKRRGLNSARIGQMVEIIEQMSLKPEKGRRKDLRRIESAVAAMRQIAAKKKGDA